MVALTALVVCGVASSREQTGDVTVAMLAGAPSGYDWPASPLASTSALVTITMSP